MLNKMMPISGNEDDGEHCDEHPKTLSFNTNNKNDWPLHSRDMTIRIWLCMTTIRDPGLMACSLVIMKLVQAVQVRALQQFW